MGAHLSKDEKNYIQNNASNSYLLLKHEPLGGIDCFSVYDENDNKVYSVNIRGGFRKKGTESPTLEISDEASTVVGTMKWNNEYPSLNPFIVQCVDRFGNIKEQYEQRRFFKKYWYETSFSDWILDYRTITDSDGQTCAEIKSISNYKKNLRGTKQLRCSYLIDRYYDTEYTPNNVMVLLFWAIRYICDDYVNNHTDLKSKYIQKNRLETKIDNTLASVKSSLSDRKDTIEDRQEDATKELRNRAKEYVDDKQKRLDDKAESRKKKKKILLVLLKVLICLAAPVVGMFAVALINSYLAIKIDLTFAGAFFFITAILIANSDNPNLVMFYEWLKLVLLCIIGLIACGFLNAVIKHFLGLAGVVGIDIEIPLKLVVIAGICKWRSRYIEKLVIVRNAFSIIQFISIGLLLGHLSLQYFDHLGRLSSLVGIVAIVVAILLSKAMILVRKSVKYCIIGIAAGILLVCLVEPVLSTIFRFFFRG